MYIGESGELAAFIIHPTSGISNAVKVIKKRGPAEKLDNGTALKNMEHRK